MKIHNCEQRSEEWKKIRLGKATASHFKAIMADGVGRKDYMERLVDERITGQRQDTFENAAMRWGTQTEPQAKTYYAAERKCSIQEVGFIEFDDYPVGASPDGLIGDNGQIEIKCPNTSTHKKWAKAGILPPEHKAQVQGQLWLSNREWCDFVSFDPRVPTNPMFCIRVEQDEEYIELLSEAVLVFTGEMLELEKQVRAGQAKLSPKQADAMSYDMDIEEEWHKANDKRIRGMCRNGLVRSYRETKGFLTPIPSHIKDIMDGDVDYIIDGQVT